MITHGIFIEFGIQTPKPITNLPPGAKVRIRMRNTGCVQVFVRTDEDVRQYRVKRVGDTWELWPAQGLGSNVRRTNNTVHVNGR